MPKDKKPYTTLGRLIADNEERMESYEDDAGDVIYFDPFANEWLVLGGR